MRVFVYGTLLTGRENHRLIAPFTAGVEPGELAGELYHLKAGYPALVLGGSLPVRGELVALRQAEQAVAILDQLEDYHGPGRPDNLYERVRCTVRTARGQLEEAEVYVWSRPEQLPAAGERVFEGCWRSFMEARGS